MTASEAIAELQRLIEIHGDLNIHESDYGMPIREILFEEEFSQTRGAYYGPLKNVIILG